MICEPGWGGLDFTTASPYIVISFEWDEPKAARNLRVHRVSFEQAAAVFRDLFAIEEIDMRMEYGEERSTLLGLCGEVVLLVVFTERGDRIRIISARRAQRHEHDRYYRENGP